MTVQEYRRLGESTWLGRRLGMVLGNQVGAIDARIGAIIGGVITLVIGMVLASTVPASELLAGARIRGGDGFSYTVVNRRVNGDVIVRRESDGARAKLRPTD